LLRLQRLPLYRGNEGSERCFAVRTGKKKAKDIPSGASLLFYFFSAADAVHAARYRKKEFDLWLVKNKSASAKEKKGLITCKLKLTRSIDRSVDRYSDLDAF
jgi:hypothetical protein